MNRGKTVAWPGWLLGLGGLAGLLLLWWLGVKVFGAADGLSARFSLAATFGSLWELLGRGELYLHIAVSLKRIVVGLFLALLVGVPLGLLVGSSRNLEAATTPDRLAYSELMAMVLLIGLLGFALDAFARWLHQRWVHGG